MHLLVNLWIILAGDAIAFVDCHCECTTQWLEPLLEQTALDNTTLAVPVTDDIDSRTFE